MYMCTHTHICIHVTTINKKRGQDLRKSNEGYIGGFGEKKGKGEMVQLYHNSKK